MAYRSKKSESGVEVLMSLPWQVSVILGAVVFVGFKWVLPSIWATNLVLSSMATGLSSMAWLPGGLLLLIGAFAFVGQRMKRSKVLATNNRVSQSEWRPPAWASKETGKRGPLSEPRPDSDIRIEPSTNAKAKPTEWSLELIREIEWKRFEDLCQKFYEAKGIRCETTPLGPDGGIDIRIYQDESGNATSIVQCKAWGARYVGVQPVRELLGVMTHEKIEKAFFMTSGRFSDDAKDVAEGNQITLIDGQMLLMMLKRLPSAGQNELLTFATEGDYTTPTCPGCGNKMRSVSGKAGRPNFWGCPDYPKCRQRLGMRRAG
ncbi:Restriction endonuclease [Candidatus Propionivibrio aalborgensis]|uniref:Restriction endonuclease n=2 Tax=Candidatus Propionivibrio aalborgensis TaxID=1860101 RepID=A0A1A8XHU8_9RHOO|nr:Restriction endonuclease [Candidatus Propionivibrio aalborgensis]